jgi:hypothetical protein
LAKEIDWPPLEDDEDELEEELDELAGGGAEPPPPPPPQATMTKQQIESVMRSWRVIGAGCLTAMASPMFESGTSDHEWPAVSIVNGNGFRV